MHDTSPRPAPRRVPFLIHDEVVSPLDSFTIPQDHFLAQAPLTPPPTDSVLSWSNRARPDTSSLAAADYDVSVVTGFLPPEEPVQRVKHANWELAEQCLDQARAIVAPLDGGGVGRLGEEWRKSARELPLLSVDLLTTLPLLRRAHVLLSFLSHFYIHSTFPALTSVPASLAVPWVAVSEKLGIPPVLNYADTVLWNWKMVDPALGLRADNLEIPTTFTGSPSENAFFLLSLLCELYGPPALRLMSATLDESFFADELALPRIAGNLHRIASIIDELRLLMRDATNGTFGPNDNERIVPAVFYWEIRPWFNGGKWIYEGVGDADDDDQVMAPTGIMGKQMEWGGPSAGQSSLVHALDLFLGVDHTPRGPPPGVVASTPLAPAASTAAMDPSAPLPPRLSRTITKKDPAPANSDSTFMVRASQYMPSFHRAFLRHLSALHIRSSTNPAPIPSLRQLAQTHPTQLQASYDVAITAMKLFRDEHMRLASTFIVTQAKKEPGKDTVFWAGWETKRIEREELLRRAQASGEQELEREKMMGTGGTDLVTFLKGCTDRTKAALLTGAAPRR